MREEWWSAVEEIGLPGVEVKCVERTKDTDGEGGLLTCD